VRALQIKANKKLYALRSRKGLFIFSNAERASVKLKEKPAKTKKEKKKKGLIEKEGKKLAGNWGPTTCW